VVVGADHTCPRSSPSARIRFLLLGQGLGLGAVAPRQFGFGVGERTQRGFPVGFQPAGYQPVLRVDRPVAAFRLARGVAGPVDLPPPLFQRRVVAGFQRLGGGQARGERGRGDRGEESVGDGGVDRDAADP
jgi:hypothetical protein